MRAGKNRRRTCLYRDIRQPVEVRVNDLLDRMTLEEKIRETGFVMGKTLLENNRYAPTLVEKRFGNMGIGGIMDPHQGGRRTARIVNALQKYLVDRTRLGIPALIMAECLHGHLSPGATTFPQSIGLSCSWNPGMIRRMAAAVAGEASAVGIRQCLSPNLDLGRDPRWGRVEETYGEDVHLCTQMGLAYVEGMQGGKDPLAPEKLAVTVKHFAGHCDPQGGLNIGPADIGERKLREEYLPPFKAAVEAGALSVMNAYNEIDGVPCVASKFLLRKILREEWGFEGYVFADFGSVELLGSLCHNLTDSRQEAGRIAFEAGVDLETCQNHCYDKKLLELVRKGKVSEKRLDEAVGNILRVKFMTGLFDRPYVNEGRALEIVHCNKHVKLARRLAGESIVLLKNEKNLLPIDKRKLFSVAVIGPNADVAECGDYCFPKTEDVSPLEGIRAAVQSKTKVTFASGCDMHDLSKDGFDEAVQAARDADVALMFMGGSSMSLGGVGWVIDGKPTRPSTCGEGFDRADLNLPGVQQELVAAVAETGTPVVVVLINGRPLSTAWIAEHIPAVLEAWYPGEQGGHAIADILFGKVNPSAKLTMTIPRSVGQVPIYYCRKPSAGGYYKMPGAPGRPGRDYVYSESSPLYDFGYGLSYTRFRYSKLRVSPSRIAPDGMVTVSVTIRNAGDRAGKEVVQLYINDVVSSVTTPVKLLKRFEKITLKPGEVKTVTFEIGPEDLSLLNEEMQRIVEPGAFEVIVGGLKKQFEVV